MPERLRSPDFSGLPHTEPQRNNGDNGKNRLFSPFLSVPLRLCANFLLSVTVPGNRPALPAIRSLPVADLFIPSRFIRFCIQIGQMFHVVQS
jgi:hypothetical protein